MTNNMNTLPNNPFQAQKQLQERQLFNSLIENRASKQIDAPRGYLLKKQGPIKSFATGVADTGKDIVNIGKTLKTGKSNDHELGRMNDVGLKVGALAIGLYLSKGKNTLTEKAMEFIGPATFISAMSLWPKLAIDKPTEMRFGFDPRQKFVDSQGRKKEVFQDNGYLPFDLYSDEKVNEIADNMGVPKDIEDRRGYTLERMRQIALQSRTTGMMTAGFAVPLMTALACTGVKPAVENIIIDAKARASERNIEKDFKAALSGKIGDLTDGYSKLDKVVKTVKFDALENKDAFSHFQGAVAKHLNPIHILDDHSIKMFNGIKDFDGVLKSDIKNLYDAAVKSATPVKSDAEILQGIKGVFGEWADVVTMDGKKLFIDGLETKMTPKAIIEAGGFTPNEAKTVMPALEAALGISNIDKEAAAKALSANIKGAYKAIQPVNGAIKATADAVSALTLGRESMLSRSSRDVVGTFLKKTGLNTAVLETVTGQGDGKVVTSAVDTISGCISKLAKDDTALGDLIKKLSKNYGGTSDKLLGTVETGIGKIGEALKAPGLEHFTNLKNQEAAIGNVLRATANEGMKDYKALIGTIITAADMEKRLATGLADKSITSDFAQRCRMVMYDSTMAGTRRGMAMTGVDFSDVNKFIFQAEIDPGIAKKLEAEGGLGGMLTAFRQKRFDVSGKVEKPSADYDLVKNIVKTVKDTTAQAANDKNWLKTFGGMAVVLVAATFVAQTFFGKMKEENKYVKKQGVQNAG
ncbi:hypothetical protein tpqmel_0190 [Candidatus Gastranaerophilus sp. (ex Termes propinquus)]|nr:hypothetical protein tpqmel_0190 [Candidatus Gastranaerophilus sp. (ex Termes propinquus)]